MKTTLQGTLEIDHDRGVVYFHLDEAASVAELGVHTVLRIQGLPRPIPEIKERMLDVSIRPTHSASDFSREASDWEAWFDWSGV